MKMLLASILDAEFRHISLLKNEKQKKNKNKNKKAFGPFAIAL